MKMKIFTITENHRSEAIDEALRKEQTDSLSLLGKKDTWAKETLEQLPYLKGLIESILTYNAPAFENFAEKDVAYSYTINETGEVKAYITETTPEQKEAQQKLITHVCGLGEQKADEIFNLNDMFQDLNLEDQKQMKQNLKKEIAKKKEYSTEDCLTSECRMDYDNESYGWDYGWDD